MSVLLGQGAGGGALALLPADRTIAAQHAWLSPLPPEGASAIVHRSTDFAPAISEAQGVNVASLYANGLVEHIVDEREAAPLLERKGFGPVTAAVCLIGWSHQGRVRSNAAYGSLAGANPIPASSGNTVRHRLNRGSDRKFE